MKCLKCGAENLDNAAFCSVCGESLNPVQSAVIPNDNNAINMVNNIDNSVDEVTNTSNFDSLNMADTNISEVNMMSNIESLNVETPVVENINNNFESVNLDPVTLNQDIETPQNINNVVENLEVNELNSNSTVAQGNVEVPNIDLNIDLVQPDTTEVLDNVDVVSKKSKKPLILVLLLLVILLAAGVVYYFVFFNKDKNDDKTTTNNNVSSDIYGYYATSDERCIVSLEKNDSKANMMLYCPDVLAQFDEQVTIKDNYIIDSNNNKIKYDLKNDSLTVYLKAGMATDDYNAKFSKISEEKFVDISLNLSNSSYEVDNNSLGNNDIDFGEYGQTNVYETNLVGVWNDFSKGLTITISQSNNLLSFVYSIPSQNINNFTYVNVTSDTIKDEYSVNYNYVLSGNSLILTDIASGEQIILLRNNN